MLRSAALVGRLAGVTRSRVLCPVYGPFAVRAYASATSSVSSARAASPFEQPLTEEEKNQAAWERFDQAKLNLYVIAGVVGGVLLVRYWYKRELDHFLHHRHQQEPYAFFIKRDDTVAAGFWPGRACQFLEFNCYAATYDAAEKMLKEKQQGGARGDDQHQQHAH